MSWFSTPLDPKEPQKKLHAVLRGVRVDQKVHCLDRMLRERKGVLYKAEKVASTGKGVHNEASYIKETICKYEAQLECVVSLREKLKVAEALLRTVDCTARGGVPYTYPPAVRNAMQDVLSCADKCGIDVKGEMEASDIFLSSSPMGGWRSPHGIGLRCGDSGTENQG